MADINNKENLEISGTSSRLRSIRRFLNVIIISLLMVNIFLLYFFYIHPEFENNNQTEINEPVKTIQIDVLNGCGVDGVASQFTNILRQKGLDVVDIKNYLSFEIPNTIIIDRLGNRKLADRVASALGLEERNIISQINQDYYVDVTVVIGKDYSNLKSLSSSNEKEKY